MADPTVGRRFPISAWNLSPRELGAPAAFVAFHETEVEKWFPIVKAADIKAVTRGAISTMGRVARPARRGLDMKVTIEVDCYPASGSAIDGIAGCELDPGCGHGKAGKARPDRNGACVAGKGLLRTWFIERSQNAGELWEVVGDRYDRRDRTKPDEPK